MPILTFNNSQGTQGGLLNSRVLIGRRLPYGVSLAETSVSRLHAWIDPVADEQGDWVITDAGSKTGTFVNDQKITRSHLHDGDVIRVGKVLLQFHEDESLPAGTEPIELTAPPPVVRGDGILFECACGAPLWAQNELAGKRGMCRHCRQPVTVPGLVLEEDEPPAAWRIETPLIADEHAARRQTNDELQPPSVDEPSAAEQPAYEAPVVEPRGPLLESSKHKSRCAVCHGPILPDEDATSCPDCAMNFHVECWQENLGCSSYGCPQVNCLQTTPEPELKLPQPPAVQVAERASGSPWELILFAASIVALLLGPLTFGGLAAIVVVLSLIMLLQNKPARRVLLIAAMVIGAIGIVCGLIGSDLMFFNAKHLPAMLRNRL